MRSVYDATRRHGYECFGDLCGTVQSFWGTGGGNVPIVLKSYGLDSYNQEIHMEASQTLKTDAGGDSIAKVVYMEPACIGNGQLDQLKMSPRVGALNCMHDQQIIMETEEQMKSTVRRLTPLECTRLQGFPDNWVDIGEWTDTKNKKHQDADSPKYKALGNSIALPFWKWLARRIAAQYEHPVTIGSLFDGIGGFPLAFEQAGGKAIWASEIEEFPIAVTKIRFPEDDE